MHKVFFILVKNKKFKLDSLFSRMCRSIYFFAIDFVDKTNKSEYDLVIKEYEKVAQVRIGE